MKLYYTVVETAMGWLLLIGREGTLVEVWPPRPTSRAARGGVPPAAVESADGFGDLPERLRLYFEGKPVDFSNVEVSFDGLGQFEERVLRQTMKVPYGKLMSYGALAAAAGSPGAARAAGNAMRRNPAPIVVPCHRVIHADGSIGGYSGGLDLKRRLLALEGIVL